MRAPALEPPFSGTVYVDPDVIRSSDWSAYYSLSYAGIAPRVVFDWRDAAFTTKDMHIFNAAYADRLDIEVQVNSLDYAKSAAELYATIYAEKVGRLPTSLREDVETMTIHAGNLAWGGGNNNILIHADIDVGIIDYVEEILFHEATHVSYGNHQTLSGWLAVVAADPTFISTYARDYPDREDVAESLLMWYAVRYCSDRIDPTTRDAIEGAIPNRLSYFDGLPFVVAAPLDGDYNNDGAVDAADYVLWRKNNNSGVTLPNDSTPGTDTTDYAVWRTHFGQTSGSGSSANTNAAVPEPAVVGMLLFAAAGSCLRKRRAA
jgi:hypothetical protein